MATNRPSREKVELSFKINSFQRPLEMTGYEAWTELILRLIFMRKGSYPSQPEMGGDFDFIEYNDFDTVKSTYVEEFQNQINTYLSDIPLYGIDVDYTDEKIAVFTILFTSESGNIVPVVISAQKVINIINFEVIM